MWLRVRVTQLVSLLPVPIAPHYSDLSAGRQRWKADCAAPDDGQYSYCMRGVNFETLRRGSPARPKRRAERQDVKPFQRLDL